MAECISPWQKDGIPLPCGKCYECKARKISSWSYRLMKEAERSSSALFVTLTFDTDHVPITEKGYMSLSKEKLQNFFKYLRKLHRVKLKYYACGEYGGKTNRPHYHIILFNADKDKVAKAWTQGTIHIGEVTAASVGYTLKYISKNGKIPAHKNDDRIPEFSLMSKKLGDNYLTPQMIKWHKADYKNRMYVNLLDGKKIAMPRYFKDKIYTKGEKQRVSEHVRKQRINKDLNTPREKILADMTQQDLIRREKVRKNTDNRNQSI